MFICGECKQQQPAKTSEHKKIIKTRKKTYPSNTFGSENVGSEIVKEISICPTCHKEGD